MAVILEERLFLLMLALYASLLLGGPPTLHRLLGLDAPARWLRGWVSVTAHRLNRPQRSAATRRRRGLLLLVMTLLAGLCTGMAVHAMADMQPGIYALEVALLAMFIPLRFPFDETRDIASSLAAGTLAEARQAAANLLRRDAESADAHTLLRACLEYLARQVVRVSAIAFWYVLGGLPGALAYGLATRLAGVSEASDPAARAVQFWPKRVSQTLEAIPSRLTVLLLLLAALIVPGTRYKQGFSGALAATSHPLLSTLSGLLNLSLGGPRRWKGEQLEEPWLGSGTARAVPADLRRGQWLCAVASGLLVLAVTAANL